MLVQHVDASFAAGKLAEIAALEHATVVSPDSVTVPARPLRRPLAEPQLLDIAFEDGVPVSINGVHMTLTELMESIETITGPDSRKLEMWGEDPKSGQEYKMMEIALTREGNVQARR